VPDDLARLVVLAPFGDAFAVARGAALLSAGLLEVSDVAMTVSCLDSFKIVFIFLIIA
jgi:hypothetical protein